MTHRGRVAAVGLGLVLLYLLLASVSARLDPFAARPVLDGLAPPPPYRWADPPPALASGNNAPVSRRFTVGYIDGAGSSAGVFSTSDQQVTVALTTGSIPPQNGASSITLTITQSAPPPDLALPGGGSVAGNLIEVAATYDPRGQAVATLAKPGEIVLAYPLLYPGLTENKILTSPDGSTWTPIRTKDAIVHQVVRARITSVGYFVVMQSPPASAAPSGRHGTDLVVVTAAIAMLAILVLAVALRTRARRSPTPPRREPPTRERDPFDPWET